MVQIKNLFDRKRKERTQAEIVTDMVDRYFSDLDSDMNKELKKQLDDMRNLAIEYAAANDRIEAKLDSVNRKLQIVIGAMTKAGWKYEKV